MTRRRNYPGQLQQLANTILDMRDQLAVLRTRASTILLTDTDPDDDDPTNVWVFPDGRLRVRLPDGSIRQLQLNTGGATTSSVAMPADDAVPQTFQEEYVATWSEVYAGDAVGSGLRSGVPTLRWGPADRNSHGNQRVMIGWDAAGIAADLAGARVTEVEVWLAILDAGDPEAEVDLGLHNAATAPATYATTYRGTTRQVWTRGEAAWRDVSRFVAEGIRDNLVKGLTIEVPNSSQAVAYAGSVASGQAPRLRVTYVK